MNDLKTVERDKDLADNSEQMNSIAAQSALSSPITSDPYQNRKADLKNNELKGSLCTGIDIKGGNGGNLMSSNTKSIEKLKNWNQLATAGRDSMEEQTISRYLVNNSATHDSIPRQDKMHYSGYQSPQIIQNFDKHQNSQKYGQGSAIVVHGESNSRDYINYTNQKMISEDLITIKHRKQSKDSKEDQPSGIFSNNEHIMPSRNEQSSYYNNGPSTIDLKPQSFKSNVIEEHKIHMQYHNNVVQAARNLRNPIQGMQHSQQQLPRANFDNFCLNNENDQVKINQYHANTLNNSRGQTPMSSIQNDDQKKDLIRLQNLQNGKNAQTRLSFYDSNQAQSNEFIIRPYSKQNYVDTTNTLSHGEFQDLDSVSRQQNEKKKSNTNNESDQIAQVNSFYNKNELEQNSLNQRMIELKKEIIGKNNTNMPEVIQKNQQQQVNRQKTNISQFSKQSGIYEETKDATKRDGPSKDFSYPIDTSGLQSEPTRSMQMNRSVQIIDINTNDIKTERNDIQQHKKYQEKEPKSTKSAKSTRSASLRASSKQRPEPYTASYFQSLNNLYGNIPKKRSGSMKRVEFQKDIKIIGDFDVDRFYMKLMKKERQEFKKILKSQEMVIRFEVEKKLKKQLLEAEEKTKRSQELEKNFIFAKSNNQRLRNEHEKMIQKFQSLQNKAKTAQEREHEMRETLEEMWQRYEQNKQVLIDATRLEVQQEKEKEILELKAQIQDTTQQLEDQNRIFHEKEDLRLQVEILENQKTDLVKESAKLKAQMEKREQENKKLKSEVQQTHAIKIKQLQQNYEDVIKKFEDLASKSNNINVITRQYSIDEDTFKNFNNLHSVDNSDHPNLNDSMPFGRNPIRLSSANGTQKTINIHDQGREYSSNGTQKKQRKSKNEWKLRCQLLADKYFGIIKDLKNQLKKLKKQSAESIEQVRSDTTQEIMKRFENQIDIIYLQRENQLLRSKFQATPGFQSHQISNNQLHKKDNQDLILGLAQSQRASLGISEPASNRLQAASQQLLTAKTSSQVSFRSQFGQNYSKLNQLNETHSLTKKQLNSKNDASSLKLSDNNFILPLQKIPDNFKHDSKSYGHSSLTNRAQREPPTILLRSEYTNSHSPKINLKNKSQGVSDPDNSNLQNSNSDISSNVLLRNCNPLFQNKISKNESQQFLEREAQFQEIYQFGDSHLKTQDQRDLQHKKTSTIDVKSNSSHVSLRQPVHHLLNRALSGDATTNENLQNLREKKSNPSNHSFHSGSASLNAYYQKHKYQIYKDQTTLSQQNNNLGIYSGAKDVSKMSTLQQILKSPGTSDISNDMNRQILNFNSTQQVELGVGGMFSVNKHSTQDSKDYFQADINSRINLPQGNEHIQEGIPKRFRQNNLPILVSFQRSQNGSLLEQINSNEPFTFIKEASRETPELNGTYTSLNANFGGNKTSQKSTAQVPTSRKETAKNIHHQQSNRSQLSKKESKLSKQASDMSSQKSKNKNLSNKSQTSQKQNKPIIRHESTPKNVIPQRSKNRSVSSNNSKILGSADHKQSRQPSPYSFVQSQKRRPSSSRSQNNSHKRQKSIKGINDLKGVLSPRKKRQDLSQDRVSPNAGIEDKTYDYFSRVKQPALYYNRLVNSELELKQIKDSEEQTFEQLNAEIQKSIDCLKEISKYAHASASATSSQKLSSSRGQSKKVKGILKTSSSQVNTKKS